MQQCKTGDCRHLIRQTSENAQTFTQTDDLDNGTIHTCKSTNDRLTVKRFLKGIGISAKFHTFPRNRRPYRRFFSRNFIFDFFSTFEIDHK